MNSIQPSLPTRHTSREFDIDIPRPALLPQNELEPRNTPPDSPHYYAYITEVCHVTHRAWRGEEAKLSTIIKEKLRLKKKVLFNLKEEIEEKIRIHYPHARVLEEGHVDHWYFWLVENQGRKTVVFHGTLDWVGPGLKRIVLNSCCYLL